MQCVKRQAEAFSFVFMPRVEDSLAIKFSCLSVFVKLIVTKTVILI